MWGFIKTTPDTMFYTTNAEPLTQSTLDLPISVGTGNGTNVFPLYSERAFKLVKEPTSASSMGYQYRATLNGMTDKRWSVLEWAMDLRNYPDPEHLALRNEYDWDWADERGLVHRYIKHIGGSISSTRKYAPRPYTYWAFAFGAMTLINNPSLIRTCYSSGLTGDLVVKYVNTVDIKALFPLDLNDESKFLTKVKSKKNLIPVDYSALYARVFNEFSGVEPVDALHIRTRGPHLSLCKNCGAITEGVTGVMHLRGDEGYEEIRAQMHKQHAAKRDDG